MVAQHWTAAALIALVAIVEEMAATEVEIELAANPSSRS